MSAVQAPLDTAVLAPRAAVLVVAAGCGLLAARPILVPIAGRDPTAILVAIFVVLLAAGGLWPLAEYTASLSRGHDTSTLCRNAAYCPIPRSDC